MESREQIRRTVQLNAEAVRAARQTLLREHGPGPVFVLAREQEVVGIYGSQDAALEDGARKFADGHYSVHELTSKPKVMNGISLAR